MDAQAMIDHLAHEQRQLLTWIAHAQKNHLYTVDNRMAYALSQVATMLRALKQGGAVDMLSYLQVTDDSATAVHAYWDAWQERQYQDRIWSTYLQTRKQIYDWQRKGLVERDLDGNYDFTPLGREYFSVDDAA